MRIVIFTLASKQHGLGHVKRMLTLARELTARGVEVVFATERATLGVQILAEESALIYVRHGRQQPYPIYDYADGDFGWTNFQADACIIDIEHGPDRAMLEAARKFPRVIVVAGSGYTLSDWSAVQDLVDLVICQSIIETKSDRIAMLCGVEYMMIDPAYAQLTPRFDGPIVVSMGGTDPHNLLPIVRYSLVDVDRKTILMLGKSDSLLPHLDGAALLVGALGMTAYEAAAAGVPMLLSNWSSDHEKTTLELQQRKVACNLGRWDRFDADYLRELVKMTLSDRSVWQTMSDAGKRLVDGQGVKRVADRLIEMLTPEKVHDEA